MNHRGILIGGVELKIEKLPVIEKLVIVRDSKPLFSIVSVFIESYSSLTFPKFKLVGATIFGTYLPTTSLKFLIPPTRIVSIITLRSNIVNCVVS